MGEVNDKIEDLFSNQLRDWALAKANYDALAKVKTRTLFIGEFPVVVQYNPERIRSSAAKTDAATLRERPCFFCTSPEEQESMEYNDAFEIRVNPYPIDGRHLTLPLKWHERQQILPYYEDMLDMAFNMPEYVIFYNGPKCGASAPDHMHFQAISKGNLPIEENYKRAQKRMVWQGDYTTLYALHHFIASVFVLASSHPRAILAAFNRLYDRLEIKEGEYEPMVNIVTWKENDVLVTCLFPRKELRPSCFYAEGEGNILISPATVEMAGLFITPREKDFEKVTASDLETILKEVSLPEEAMNEVIRKFIQESE